MSAIVGDLMRSRGGTARDLMLTAGLADIFRLQIVAAIAHSKHCDGWGILHVQRMHGVVTTRPCPNPTNQLRAMHALGAFQPEI